LDKIVVFILLALLSREVAEPSSSSWIIWNVGQGEWVTHVLPDRCHHFDMGGERWPKKAIGKVCGDKMNFAYFSHWDMDHVGFAARARSVLPKICLGQAPIGATSKRKQQIFAGWKACAAEASIRLWQPPPARAKKKSSNEQSQIYRETQMLVTGDAPKDQELLFVNSSENLKRVHWLVLGHHGSRTSTSDALLQSLPNLHLAIASARHAKYGHPHAEVLRRLRYFRVPVLSTEDWGSIEIRE